MGCFTFLSTATVMVLSILLLLTTPVFVLRKFLSAIFTVLKIIHLNSFFAIPFSNARGLYAKRGCASDFPGEKSHARIPASSAEVHLPGCGPSNPPHSYPSCSLQIQFSLTSYVVLTF